jgi:hypothetical protein
MLRLAADRDLAVGTRTDHREVNVTGTMESSFWYFPADADVVRYGEYSLTIVHPGSPTDAADLPAHDPAAARRFAESFGTVDTILEDLGTVPATDAVSAGTRADLELVRVGCWGASPRSPTPASCTATVSIRSR